MSTSESPHINCASRIGIKALEAALHQIWSRLFSDAGLLSDGNREDISKILPAEPLYCTVKFVGDHTDSAA